MMHIFHVHTYRCKHASDEPDEAYVKTALSLGAEKITFTDHAPFPGDSFKNRMSLSLLPEYIGSLKSLQKKYEGKIEVEIGLEVEFLPSMMNFYAELKKNHDLDVLMLGQHFYEHQDGSFSCNDDEAYKKQNEFRGCCNAMIEGMRTGMFGVLAHPDRFFRHCMEWTPEMTRLSEKMIETAALNNVTLEKNLSSYELYATKTKPFYWRNEFWKLVEQYNKNTEKPVRMIQGFDAHSSEEIRSLIKYVE